MINQKKTRAMATWAEERGFRTAIIERAFAADFKIADGDPRVAVCGVDNALARASLEDVGFARIVEAGLGKGAGEYLAFQMHTFPASRTAHRLWDRRTEATSEAPALIQNPAYRALAAEGMDACGLTQLAGRTVGASFVGLATAALVVAELVRMAAGAHRYQVVDGSLRALEHCVAMPAQLDGVPFNPGIAAARSTD